MSRIVIVAILGLIGVMVYNLGIPIVTFLRRKKDSKLSDESYYKRVKTILLIISLAILFVALIIWETLRDSLIKF